MKRFATLAIALLITVPVFAGIAYDFSMTTTGEGQSQKMAGVAKVEGSKMRMEIQDGDEAVFESGSVILSRDGGATMTVLDPSDKTYFELSVDQIFNQLTSMMQSMGSNFEMSIKNQKVDVEKLGAGDKIAGHATTRYRIDAKYDIVMSMMGMNMTMSVDSSTLMWATPDIAKDAATIFQSKGLKTGMKDLDALIEKYADEVDGFPLRTEADSTMLMMGRTIKSKTVTEVSNVREAKIPNSEFDVPGDFRKVDGPLEAMMKNAR